jgi:hypothetical protein
MRYSGRAVAVMTIAAAMEVARADARAPSALVQELAHAPISDVSTRVAQLPSSLRVSLAKTFQQRHLYIADAGQPYQITDVVILRPGQRELPFRRLLFAFRAGTHHVVYYEMGGYGQSVSAVVFAASDSRSYRFVWGGIERDYERPAKTPAAVVHRIVRNELLDHLPFIW